MLLYWNEIFCGMLLCCFDAPAIIKRNGPIVKYAHFSILNIIIIIIIIIIITTTKYGPCESTTWPVSFYTN